MQTRTRNVNQTYVINKPQASKKQPDASVELTPEERNRYELQAVMIYYNNIVENKIAKGEEVTEEDIENLDKATDAYEAEIKPYLTV